MEMGLLSLLSLLLWCLLSPCCGERSSSGESDLELEGDFADEEVDVRAVSATPEDEAVKLYMSLTRDCVIRDWQASNRSVFPDLKAKPDGRVDECRAYPSFQDLLDSKWHKEVHQVTVAERVAEMFTGRAEATLQDIDRCLFAYGLLVEEEASWRNFYSITGPKADEFRSPLLRLVQACQNKTETKVEQMKAHWVAELDQCNGTTKSCKSDKCKEAEGKMCPEGTACDCATKMTPQKAQTAGKTTWAVWVGSKVLIGAIAGFLGYISGGIFLGALAGYCFPAGDSAVTVGMTLAFSYETGCVCNLQMCQQVGDSCRMDIQRNTSNPYAHLPPIGFKCAFENVHHNWACVMNICSRKDQRALGFISNGVYNCVPEMWHPNITEGVKNSPSVRNHKYKERGIQPRST